MNELLSPFELVEIVITLAGQIDSIFNYWISASFAVVVSAFIGREHFNYSISVTISALYTLASLMFLARAIFMGLALMHYAELAGDALPPNFGYSIPALAFTRGPVFFLGFAMTQFYLWQTYYKLQKSEQADS